MIPKEGNDLIELHMQNAREAEQDDFAEKSLGHVEAILAYALACNHVTCIEYGNRLVLLKLIRAQRKNRAQAELPKTYTSYSDGVRAVQVKP